MARVGAAIHSVRAVDPRPRPGWRPSPASDPGRSTPTSPSSRPRTTTALAAYGMTPTGLLAEAGALSERFTAVHATHLDRADFALLGGAGCGICLCPTTERDLADGVGPARRLAAGRRTSLPGHRLPRPDRHLRGSARGRARRAARERDARRPLPPRRCCALRPRAAPPASAGPRPARIEPGALADLVTVGLDGVRLAGIAAGPCARVRGLRRWRRRRSRRDRRRPVRGPRRRPSRPRRGRPSSARRSPCCRHELAGDRQHRPAGHQRPGAGRGSAGNRARRGSGLRGRPGGRGGARPGRRPIGASTRAAAA